MLRAWATKSRPCSSLLRSTQSEIIDNKQRRVLPLSQHVAGLESNSVLKLHFLLCLSASPVLPSAAPSGDRGRKGLGAATINESATVYSHGLA